jgi:hypothetical protein
MSEIDRPANAPKAATESAPTEIRRPRVWRLSPEMLREMGERTEHTKSLVARPSGHRQLGDGAAAARRGLQGLLGEEREPTSHDAPFRKRHWI